jgi:hypothetical protein
MMQEDITFSIQHNFADMMEKESNIFPNVGK